jgi:hypothetical protein
MVMGDKVNPMMAAVIDQPIVEAIPQNAEFSSRFLLVKARILLSLRHGELFLNN